MIEESDLEKEEEIPLPLVWVHYPTTFLMFEGHNDKEFEK